ncbi:transcription factor WhiB [Gordonia jacobaea]|uniref:Transcriptional regulator WhiB n=1 Tax=Gordonia jacobaea TaxID=122202 RepID=A0ABR5IFH9_9ACTN|nr:transcription factor WhiB [Gordonia jacobaea]
MAFDNAIGNPLEPHGHSEIASPLSGDANYTTLGPVDDSLIGTPEIGTPEVSLGADENLQRRHLSLVPNDFEGLFDAIEDQWQDRALCAQTDPEAFFPEKGGSTREAKRICQGCEVKAECLEYALHNDERFGIWGGLSERERRRLKRGII